MQKKITLTNLSNTVPDISTLVKKAIMTQKLQKLKTNMLVIPDLTPKKKKLQTFDSSYFRGKSHFKKMVYKIIYYFNQYADILK